MNNSKLKEVASQVRRDVLRMVNSAKSGHPGGALSCTDYIVYLYFKGMNINTDKFNLEGKNEDVFYLSNGHVCPAWYSTLARKGYFPISELGTLRKLGTRLQGHPTTQDGLPGIRSAAGSLGQGLSVSIGHALSKKLSNDKGIVYTLLGDGELQEGQVWEAAMFAAAHKVDNLIAAVDYNRVQIDGRTDDVIPLGDLKAKWESFGWIVLEALGNDIDDIDKTFNKAKELILNKKPVVILLHTKMGYGVDFMLDNYKWHGVAPNDEELEKALSQLKETLGDY